jgi:hypothetical protein
MCATTPTSASMQKSRATRATAADPVCAQMLFSSNGDFAMDFATIPIMDVLNVKFLEKK